jgi:hypothetical protein
LGAISTGFSKSPEHALNEGLLPRYGVAWRLPGLYAMSGLSSCWKPR